MGRKQDAPAAAAGVPVFNAKRVSKSGWCRLFRIYVSDGQVYFIRVGGHLASEWEMQKPSLHTIRHAGLVGILGEVLLRKIIRSRAQRRMAAADRDGPEMALPRHRHSFKCRFSDFAGALFDTRILTSRVGGNGRWTFATQDQGKQDFRLMTILDRKIAMDTLPKSLGDRLKVRAK
ncbi:MAG: hypothetical protein AAB215_00415 [Planctomycetota bacterium]